MAAGMDLTMLCNASFDDRKAALFYTPKLSAQAASRLEAAETERKKLVKKGNDNRKELERKLEQMIQKRSNG